MKKIIAILILFLVISVPAASEIESKYYDRFSENQAKYNQYLESANIPGILSPFVSERATVHIDGETLGIALENARITEVVPGKISNPTAEVWTTSPYADKIIESDSPLVKIASGVEKGEIRIERIGIVSQIKGFLLYMGMNILKLVQPFAPPPVPQPAKETGPAELPESLTGQRIFYGTNLVYTWGALALDKSTSQSPVAIVHNSSAPVMVNLTHFDATWIQLSLSGNNTTLSCGILELTPYTEYTVVDEDQTHNATQIFTKRADGNGKLRFEITVGSTHRVALTQIPFAYTIAQIGIVAAAGTAVAAAGSIAINKASSSLSETAVGKFDFLDWLFEKVFRIKEVTSVIAKKGVKKVVQQVEEKTLPSFSFDSKFKLTRIENAHITYVILMIFAVSAVEAWVKNRIELQIIVIGALLGIAGYLSSEFVHKYLALRYNTRLEIRSSFLGGIVTLVSAAIGVTVATLVFSRLHDEKQLNKKQRMHISVAGPLVNVMLAAILMVLGFIFVSWQPYLTGGIIINIATAFASLLPIGFLGGKKIWDYSKPLCIFLLFGTLAMQIFTSTLFA